MGQKKWYGVAAACLIVACAVVLAVVLPETGTDLTPGGEENPSVGNGETTLEREGYITGVPADAAISAPDAEALASTNVTEKFRVYDIAITKDGYNPDAITVNRGDVVQLNLTAIDGPYDFSMPYTGLWQAMVEGDTRQVSFGATSAGTFEFRCERICPDGKVIRGQLIVLP